MKKMRGGNLSTLTNVMRRIKCTNFTIFQLVSSLGDEKFRFHCKEKEKWE
jgi:hypothetical protein